MKKWFFVLLLLPALAEADTRFSGNVRVSESTSTVISKWIPFTPTDARWVDANHTHTGFYRRVGNCIEIQIKTALTGAPTTASYAVRIPAGLQFDTANMANASQLETFPWGQAIIKAAGTNYYGFVMYDSVEGTKNALTVYVPNVAATYPTYAQVTQAVPGTFANGDWVLINATLPITGW
jgi:hypothetical protein